SFPGVSRAVSSDTPTGVPVSGILPRRVLFAQGDGLGVRLPPRKVCLMLAEKCGWRPREWAAAVGLGKTTVADMIADGTIESVPVGRARIILVSPQEVLNRYA